MDGMTPGIGHNSAAADNEAQSPDLAALLDPTLLRDQLTLDHDKIFKRRDALLAGAVRFHDKYPDRPETDAESGDAADFVLQLKACAKEADKVRETEKAPILAAGRVIDAVLKAETEALLEAAAAKVQAKITKYLLHKADLERKAAEAEAKRKREEAEALAAAAEADTNAQRSDTLMDAAVEKADEAEVATKRAEASNTDLSRTRGAYGSVSSLRDNWVWSLEEPSAPGEPGGLMKLIQAVAAGKEPIHYLMVNEALISNLVRPKTGLRAITGLHIRNEPKSGTR